MLDWIKKLMTANETQSCWYYAEKMKDFYKVILEPAPEGTYIFIYETESSKFAEKDYLQDDVEDAKRFCEQELGLRKDGWKEDPSIKKLMD